MKILIDLKSIRRNPDAGQTQSFVAGQIEEVRDANGNVVGMTRDVIPIPHAPAPDYLFKYEDTKVTCKDCGASFPYGELQADCVWLGDEEGEAWSNTICPDCGAWDCVEIEYEYITEALERRKAAKKV